MRRGIVPLLLCSAITADAATVPSFCGSSQERTPVAVAIARQGRSLQSARRTAAPSADRDAGNVAILDSSGGVVTTPNPFDLTGKTVRFVPVDGGRYRVESSDAAFDAAAVEGTDVRIDDDDTREVTLGFEFPYFGRRYSRVWLNSDGNLTFGEGDPASAERSLGRLLGGPPRIAGLYRDLDPSVGGRIVVDAVRGTFTWINVPEFAGPTVQPFQIRLSPEGQIEFRYAQVRTSSAVVGISPGRSLSLELADLTAMTGQSTFAAAVAEQFTNTVSIDLARASQRFYQTHGDSYDYLLFFNNLGIAASAGAIAFQTPVRVTGRGYGLSPQDAGLEFGSPRRLQSVLNMGQLSQYPQDPYTVLPSASISGFTPMSIYAHEVGHQYLVFTRLPGDQPNVLLGRGRAHWSFFFNSDASILEGNRIEDRGPSVSPRFVTGVSAQGLSMLDQYLMGLIPPGEVPPSFYVAPRVTFYRAEDGPRPGAAFDGERINVTVDSIIDANGRRTPDSSVAQRRFRMAFVLITSDQLPVNLTDIAKLDQHRQEFERYFARITNQRAAADTSLRLAMDVAPGPAAGFIEGTPGRLRVEFAEELAAPMTLRIRSAEGRVNIPEVLVAPPGLRSVEIPVETPRAGTDTVTIEAESPAFEIAEVRLGISREDEVRLSATRTGGEVRVRVTDVNGLAYGGVPIQSDSSSAVTNEKGEAVLAASPGSLIRVTGTGLAIPAP